MTTAKRRTKAIMAGHTGDTNTARLLLSDPEAKVRASALTSLERLQALKKEDIQTALTDTSPEVRQRGLEVAANHTDTDLCMLLDDDEPLVVETACWVIGEQAKSKPESLRGLIKVASKHDDPLCREAAIAALGSIGHSDGLKTVLLALNDRPTIRRRAVLALAAFEGPEVEKALREAMKDRDWQVRQAAEDLVEPR
tara:strand:- start:84 stop:674 length:591 start_codon:yes stop_codon:yes gene_type:complete